jgi:hypothetical protein
MNYKGLKLAASIIAIIVFLGLSVFAEQPAPEKSYLIDKELQQIFFAYHAISSNPESLSQPEQKKELQNLLGRLGALNNTIGQAMPANAKLTLSKIAYLQKKIMKMLRSLQKDQLIHHTQYRLSTTE